MYLTYKILFNSIKLFPLKDSFADNHKTYYAVLKAKPFLSILSTLMEVMIISVLCNPLNSVVLGDDPP